MIRPAIDADIEWILSEGKKFFDASGYGAACTYRPADLEQTLRGLPILLVDDKRRGMAGATVFKSFFDHQTLMAQELFWWVGEEHRRSGVAVQLLDAVESAARRMGAKVLLMLCIDRLDGERVSRIYKRRGYEPAEHMFMRRL